MIGNVLFTYGFALALSLLVEIPTSQAVMPFLNYLFDNTKVQDVSQVKSNQMEANSATPTSYQAQIELPMCKEKL